MRFHYVVLLATAAFVASAKVASAVTDSKPNLAHLLTAEKNDVSAQRLLRVATTVDEDDEERTISIKSIPGLKKLKSIPGFGKLTNLFKSKITPDTFFKWERQRKSPDYVFSKLKLDKTGNKLFESPDFNVWVAYTGMAQKTHPDVAVAATLMSHYTDDALSKILEAAKKVPGTKDLATRVQTQQIEGWKNMGYSTDDVFKALKLDRGLDDLLARPNLNVWIKYLDHFNAKQTPSVKTNLLEAFKVYYTDDALSKMLEAATKVSGTKDLATKLQNTQLDSWKKLGYSTDDVFKALKLDRGLDDLLTNPNLNVWVKYMEDVAGQNAKLKTPMIDALRKHYKDADLLRVFKAAQANAQTKKLGESLEASLVNKLRFARMKARGF